ncbi:uncharacterized protein LOC126056085 isoform X2 [Helicoverpa armigera]|uniref:uncharacterized protein LOC126056085 isoform X2 n=1 Tax=Helicoverpa armigera TaxID=29058 RepID=UPI002112E8FC|nr:uncharacterized protein LOC126056085 isoform X2 [Helicoverpa armigera]
MRSALLAALLVSAAALAARESNTVKAPSSGDDREPDQEDESDSAPFMIVVEHTNGRRCGGSLVSLRTALTSAWCARGGPGAGPGAAAVGEPHELWALAPGAGAARRVARLALAAGADAARADDPWSGAAMDLAVLELEAPFGGGARSRPILMATQPAECAARATCHVVRALGRTPRLRIVDATLVPGEACAERARGWPGLRDSALCLVGPTLCSSDWGAGVVCEGKLCGVLSRSARGAQAGGEAGDAEQRGDTCGDTHVAQSVARWRKFLHCAHTLRACGLGGDCAQLCSERRLLDTEDAAATHDTTTEPADTSADTDALLPRTATLPALLPSTSRPVRPTSVAAPTRSTLRRSSVAGMQLAPGSSPPPSPRPAFEFEPNRPDFKGKPARTSRVYLKAGEYGDNGAEYGGEEAALPPGSSTPSSVATHLSSAVSPDARSANMLARVSPAVARRSRASSLSANLLYVIVAITNFTI